MQGATVCVIEIPIVYLQNAYWGWYEVELQAVVAKTAIINHTPFALLLQ